MKKINNFFSLIASSLSFFFLLTACTNNDKNHELSPIPPTEQREAIVNGQQELRGSIGTSPQWKSSWLDFEQPHIFRRGDTVRILLGGDASEVIVRFLSMSDDPNSPAGVVGNPIQVTTNGTSGEITLHLDNDYNAIKQISIHGGANPWGIYQMPPDNGSPVILHIYLMHNN